MNYRNLSGFKRMTFLAAEGSCLIFRSLILSYRNSKYVLRDLAIRLVVTLLVGRSSLHSLSTHTVVCTEHSVFLITDYYLYQSFFDWCSQLVTQIVILRSVCYWSSCY
jgi:hypothetical protein